MFVDEVTIHIKAGDGGNGAVNFRREKYVAYGGPDGGDGGRGGSIIFIGDLGLHTLMDFRFRRKFQAENGHKGDKNNRTGHDGGDCVIRVPVGTVVMNTEGQVLADIHQAETPYVLLHGGAGGRGNAHFATPTRRAPAFAKPGVASPSFEVVLQLKTIADIGLVGLPNAGKSSFLAAATRANPKIANYPFTTLHPNLGMADVGGFSFCLADIPGLIEGAAQGAGLGHAFLRHVERTRILVHVVDMAPTDGSSPLEAFETIGRELAQYAAAMAEKPLVVVANKMDLPEAQENFPAFEAEMTARGLTVYPVCAVLGEGVREVLAWLAQTLSTLPAMQPLAAEGELRVVEGQPYSIVRGEEVTLIEGPMMRRLMASVNMSDMDSFRYFQKVLRDHGVIQALRDAGVQDGDTIEVEGFQFDFVE